MLRKKCRPGIRATFTSLTGTGSSFVPSRDSKGVGCYSSWGRPPGRRPTPSSASILLMILEVGPEVRLPTRASTPPGRILLQLLPIRRLTELHRLHGRIDVAHQPGQHRSRAHLDESRHAER